MKNIFKIVMVLIAIQFTYTSSNAQNVADSTITKSKKVTASIGNIKSNKVLLVGIDPKKLDFTKITFVTEKGLSTALETEKQKLIAAGYNAEWCLVDLGETAESTVKDKLASGQYDLVLIGAGIRTLPDNFFFV